MTKLDEMRRLIAVLNEASRAYYSEDREIMPDIEYDRLTAELEALETETGVVLSGSPNDRVGYEAVDSLNKVPHESPMLSLDKTKEPAKLAAFLNGREGLLSWKLDGLTVVLRYENGALAQAVTRGNGEIGEDVTHNARVFTNIPLTTPFKGSFTVRGEAVISFEDFEKINERIPDTAARYKNPRNLTSGTVRQLNSEAVAERSVRFYAIWLVSGAEFATRSEQLSWLAGQGFTVVAHKLVNPSTVEEAVEEFKRRVAEQPVASDGLVLVLNDIAYGESLGATSKFPRYAIAFKWTDETAETILRAIEWNTSRTGLINPVAVFDTAELEGTAVTRASLHNVSILRGLELGIGDTVTVYKANMIIPQIADNLTRSNTVEIPAHCPVCGSETELNAVNDVETLYCLNPNCKAQRVRALVHFVSRDAMNIEGLSEQTIEKFIERGWVNDFTDLFKLERYGDEIMQTEGFGKKSFDNLISAVKRASENAALPNFINALGIRHVGLANAKLLAAHTGYDIERIIETARADDWEEQLSEIKGFGEAISRSLHVYFYNDDNTALVRKALSFITIEKPVTTPGQAKPLEGLTFVITGDVNRFENRKALQLFIEERGGKATGSVTGKTSYLINNDNTSTSGKNKKAAELNIPVITEEEFLRLV
jgi:DNA ligase (NAD+)